MRKGQLLLKLRMKVERGNANRYNPFESEWRWFEVIRQIRNWVGHLLGRLVAQVDLERERAKLGAMIRIGNLLAENNDPELTSELLTEFLRNHGDDPMAHVFASVAYYNINDKLMAALEAAIASMFEKDDTIAGLHYPRVARILAEMGQPEVAQRLLEVGWSKCQSWYPRSEREQARLRYFDLSEE